jgi:hypothetical protein
MKNSAALHYIKNLAALRRMHRMHINLKALHQIKNPAALYHMTNSATLHHIHRNREALKNLAVLHHTNDQTKNL